MGFDASIHQVKFVTISAAASGANALVAAVTGKKIRVLGWWLVARGAVDAYFTTASTGICGDSTNKLDFAANGVYGESDNVFGVMETAAGEALGINLSTTVIVAGCLRYIELG